MIKVLCSINISDVLNRYKQTAEKVVVKTFYSVEFDPGSG